MLKGIKTLTALLIATAAICSVNLHAMGPADFTQFEFADFTPDQSNITSLSVITADSNGFIWAGGENGLIHFTGQKAVLYRKAPGNANQSSLTGNVIRTLLFENDHILWVATTNGLSRFDTNRQEFTHYTADNHSLPGNDVSSLVRYGQQLIVGTTQGLAVIDLNSQRTFKPAYLTRMPAPFNVECLTLRGNKLWVGSTNGLLLIDLESNALQNFTRLATAEKTQPSTTAPMSSAYIPHNDVRGLYDDGTDLWIVSMGGGLMRYHQPSQQFSRVDLPGAGDVLLGITPSDRNSFWIATDNNGLWKYDPISQQSEHFAHNQAVEGSLDSDKPRAVFSDKHNNLWVGTFSGKLNFYYGGLDKGMRLKQANPLQDGLADNSILALLEVGNDLWVGTEGGLTKIDHTTHNYHQHQQANTPVLQSNAALSLAEGLNGDIWLGTWSGGLYRFNAQQQTWHSFAFSPPSQSTTPNTPATAQPNAIMADNYVWALHNDHKGHLWVGFQTQGASKINLTTGAITHYPPNPNNPKAIPWEFVRAITSDAAGTVWVGTQNGLAQYQPTTDDFTTFLPSSNDPNSLHGEQVMALYGHKNGELWIGTRNNGISVLTPDHARFIPIHLDEGLPTSSISAITADHNGNVWVTTPVGVALIPTGTYKVARVFKKSDGLTSSLFNRNAAITLQDGSLALGSKEGLNIIQPALLQRLKISKPPIITGIDINFSPSPQHYQAYQQNPQAPLALNYQQNTVGFEFALDNYYQPRLNQFAYRLVGFDKTWRITQNNNQAYYTNLPPGHYTFEIKGKAADSIWGGATHQVFFNINYPPWQQPWAYLLYAILAYFSISAYARYLAVKATSAAYLKLSRIDPLTQIPNRSAIYATVERWQKNHNNYAILVIDLDFFKRVNDTYGEEARGKILKTFARLTQTFISCDDQVARWGGEEFIIITPLHTHDNVMALAKGLCVAISGHHFEYNGQKIPVTISIGTAIAQPNEDFAKVFQRADAALYQAKHNGRNQAKAFTHSNTSEAPPLGR